MYHTNYFVCHKCFVIIKDAVKTVNYYERGNETYMCLNLRVRIVKILLFWKFLSRILKKKAAHFLSEEKKKTNSNLSSPHII